MGKNRWWRSEFKVGLVVLVALVLLSIMLIRASKLRLLGGGQEIRIRFDYVGGLLKSAPVHMYGMEIGNVEEVELVDDGVEVTVRLNKEVPIREGYQILIDILGLVGEKYVEIINGPIQNPVTQDDPLRGINPISVGRVLMKADEITDKTIGTIDFVQDFIKANEQEIHTGATELKSLIVEARSVLKKTMEDMDSLIAKINRLAECAEGDVRLAATNVKTFTEKLNADREDISSLIKEVAGDLDQLIDHTAPAIEESLANLQTVSAELPDSATNLSQNVEEFGKAMSQLTAKLDGIVDTSNEKLQRGLEDLNRSAAALNGTLDRIDRVVAGIENGQGTLGRLVTDESGYDQFDATMSAGKRAIEDVSSVTRNVDHKLRFIDSFRGKVGYELAYNDLSSSLQNRFMLSSTRRNVYFYLAGLCVREGDLTYDLQLGRRFGDLLARAGSTRSRASIGLDYWPFSKRIGNRIGISIEGVDITDQTPEMDLDFVIRLFGGWYFVFGAEDLASSDIGLNFGIRMEMGR